MAYLNSLVQEKLVNKSMDIMIEKFEIYKCQNY